MLRLLQFIDWGIPQPLARISNGRSMLYLHNAIDILLLAATRPAAAGKTYLVRDGDDLSTPQLVRYLAEGLQRRPNLIPLPLTLLRGLARFMGRTGELDRLVGSLHIDDEPIRRELGWHPRFSARHGLIATAAWYRAQRCPSTEPRLAQRAHDTDHPFGVSVVIVNYNAGEFLLESVALALQQAGEVIVVDNASSDGSIKALQTALPQVHVIANQQNLGFAKACNQGATAAQGEHILFLNPDCLLAPGAVHRLVEVVETYPDAGMVGGMLTNPDGSEQGGGRRAVPTPLRAFIRAFGLNALSRLSARFSDFALHKEPIPDQPIEVEAISGACMLAKRDALEEVGLLDEGYFMHCEDLDWCMRFGRYGWKLLFVPDAKMVHHKGHCSKARLLFVEWNKHKGMMRFYNKFFRHRYSRVLMALVTIGVWIRFALVAIYHSLRRLRCRLRLCGD